MYDMLVEHRLTRDSHPALVERVRVLYNSAIPFLQTKPLKYMTQQAQHDWWMTLNHSRVTVHVYAPVYAPWDIVAFSMVTDRGNFCTPMFAIDEAYWGLGFGEQIIRHYIELAGDKPMHGEQLVSNKAICYLNAKVGWRVVREANGVQYLIYDKRNTQDEIYAEIIRYMEEGP